jgi:hypothetical protein
MSRASDILDLEDWKKQVHKKWSKTFIMQAGPKHIPLYLAVDDRYNPDLVYGKFSQGKSIIYDKPKQFATRYGANPIVGVTK